ncbi:four helix bundle protein [Luteolibacter sp. Populi]|uniref:four helix bundle protein n=1 Tax=Luteolibacter sp. Populi TaxID=3230487 RepID=UPI003465D1F7
MKGGDTSEPQAAAGESEGINTNAQRPTPNAQCRMEEGPGKIYDLEERLLAFAASIIRLVESLPSSRAANHVAGQLLRSGTSPLANHGEAEAAESPADFIHKLRISLKELRETYRWLRLAQLVPLADSKVLEPILRETDELIRIFVASVRTVSQRRK